MPITVQLRALGGEVLGAIYEDSVELDRALPQTGDPDFPYLGLIEPYADTYFTGLQMRAVIPEVRRLKEMVPSAAVVLQALDDLCYECAETPGSLLVFLGD